MGTILVATLISLNAQPAINPILFPFKHVNIAINTCATTTPPSFAFNPTIQYNINSYIIGVIKQNGISTNDLPIKYENVVYNFEFSSLKNTSLSVENYNTTGNSEPIVKFIHNKNIQPAILV